MKKLTLTNADFIHLRDIYMDELGKIQKRAEHIKSILQKIDVDYEPSPEEELIAYNPTNQKTSGVNSKKATSKLSTSKAENATKASKKRSAAGKPVKQTKQTRKPLVNKGKGRSKVRWNDFVLQEIVEQNAPLLSSDISGRAITRFGAKEDDAPRIKRVVSGCLSKLVSVEKKLKTQKVPNSREKWYGLVEWFDSEGNLLREYHNKIDA